MKFCKNLQRVVEISAPDWRPYWLNYKLLKKLIKDLRILKTTDDDIDASLNVNYAGTGTAASRNKRKHQKNDFTASRASDIQNPRWLRIKPRTQLISYPEQILQDSTTSCLGNNPGEVIFFKILYAELKKAEFFFERASDEMAIREERVRGGMYMIKRQSVLPVDKKWQTISRAIYQLYKDLLLLETFAILTYVGFSKILKKHDKTTGKLTCSIFMETIVNKASFTRYPRLMSMISECEKFHKEVTPFLKREGKKILSEDEHLFINMIHRLNEQVLESNEIEKPPRTLTKFSCNGLESQGTNSFQEQAGENEEKPSADLFRSGTNPGSAKAADDDDQLGHRRLGDTALKPVSKRFRLD